MTRGFPAAQTEKAAADLPRRTAAAFSVSTAVSTGLRRRTTSPWSTTLASCRPSGTSRTTPADTSSCWNCLLSTATPTKIRSRLRSRRPAACSSPSCGRAIDGSSPSTRWPPPDTVTGTQSPARSPTPVTPWSWRTSSGPTCTPTGRCRETATWPAPSPFSRALSRTRPGKPNGSPGAKAHYRRRRDEHGDWHAAALRHLFNRMIGQLYHCLQQHKLFDEQMAFPAPPELAVSAA